MERTTSAGQGQFGMRCLKIRDIAGPLLEKHSVAASANSIGLGPNADEDEAGLAVRCYPREATATRRKSHSTRHGASDRCSTSRSLNGGPMKSKRCPSDYSLMAIATLALTVSCGDAEKASTGTGGGSPVGSGGTSTATGGTSAAIGGTSLGGTTGSGGAARGGSSTGGKTSTAGASGAAGTTGGAAPSGGTSAAQGGSGGATGGTAGGSSGGAGTAGTTGTDGVAPSSGCGKAPTVMSGRASIDVDGKMREYIIAVPSGYDQDKPYRLIFGWHPFGGSAQQIAQQGYFGLDDVIDGEAILVAPEGLDYQGKGLGWGNENGQDVAFANAMMDFFGAGLCIDQNRMFSTGFSFGAMFSFTLGCTADSRMRAIAPEAGTAAACNGTRPVATMAFIGVDDSLLDRHRSAVQIFVERNGCDAQTMPAEPDWCDEAGSNFQPCSCVEYQGCNPGQPVIECEYAAGHQFAPNAGETIWNFFSQF
jgi:poly(3-hydroxybutyrate) depolymerase